MDEVIAKKIKVVVLVTAFAMTILVAGCAIGEYEKKLCFL